MGLPKTPPGFWVSTQVSEPWPWPSVYVCVCLSFATLLHYCMDPDVTLENGRGAPSGLVAMATYTQNISEYACTCYVAGCIQ